MVHVEQSDFLNLFVAACEKKKEKGSVVLTFKRSDLSHGKKKENGQEMGCLVRLKSSSSKKSAGTMVRAKDCSKFSDSLLTILMAKTGNLKKRSKAERKKK